MSLATRIAAAMAVWALGALPAMAQSACQYISFGVVLTAGQWNSCFQAKNDALGFIPLNRAGGAMAGPLITAPSATASAGFNVAPGVVPASPNNGDIWETPTALWAYINGAAVQLTGSGNAGNGASISTAPLAGVTGGTYSFASVGNVSASSVTVTVSGGAVTGVSSVGNGGTGVAVGDIFAVINGNNDSLLRVTAVSGGAITTLQVLYGGSGYAAGTYALALPPPPDPFTYTLTGTLASNATFILLNGTRLAQSDQLIFNNNTTGAFTVKVQLSNGADAPTGTGVIIPQGTSNSQSTFIQTDGVTDVWIVSPASGSGTVNTGAVNDLAYYASSTNAVTQLPTCNNGAIQTSVTGVPSCAALPNANLANMAAWTFKGNPTAAPAAPADFTIDGQTLKSSPVAADELIIWDSVALAIKKATVGSLTTSSQTYNVKNYGATGNGSTNDTTAINNAVAASLGNGCVYFPTGKYIVSTLTSITATATNVPCLFGDDKHLSWIITNSATGDVLAITGGGATHAVVRDLGFDASVTRTSGSMLNFSGSFLDARRLAINDMFVGMTFSGHAAFIRDVCFNEGDNYAGTAITAAVSGAHYMDISVADTNVILDGICSGSSLAYASQPAMGINLISAGVVQITNANLIRAGNALNITPGTGNGVFSVFVDNSFFDSSISGVVINPTGTGNVARLLFNNCWFSNTANGGSGGNGFAVQNAGTGVVSGIRIQSSIAINNSLSGIAVGSVGTVTDVSVKNSHISGNGADGIFTGNNTTDFSYTDNSIGAYGGVAGNGAFGILIGAGSDHYIVSNNRWRGNTSGTISNGSSGSANNSVAGNVN